MNVLPGLKIAVLASGKGSNLLAILQAIEHGEIPGSKVVVVISNNSDSGALHIAQEHGIPAVHISRQGYGTGAEFTNALLSALRGHEVNFIVLAGYMKKVDTAIIDEYKNRIINIHPALLPEFGGEGMYGMRVHEAVLASNATMTGATVHVVDAEYDRGPIVLQRSVPVTPGDTPSSLAEKVLKVEHKLYPEAIKLFAEGRVTITAQTVVLKGNE